MSTKLQFDLNPSIKREFGTLAGDARVTRTAAALEANGIRVLRALDAAEARRVVLGLIPDGAQVHQGASQSLEVSGITDKIEMSGRYEAVRPHIGGLDRATQADEIRRLSAAPVNEHHPTHLELDPNWEYVVMFRIEPNREIMVDDLTIQFPPCIEDVESKNPYIVGTEARGDGRIHRQNWHGEWQNDNPSSIYKADDQWITGHRIRTRGQCEGEVTLVFRIRGRDRSYSRRLSIRVKDGDYDDLVFLRVPIPVAGTA